MTTTSRIMQNYREMYRGGIIGSTRSHTTLTLSTELSRLLDFRSGLKHRARAFTRCRTPLLVSARVVCDAGCQNLPVPCVFRDVERLVKPRTLRPTYAGRGRLDGQHLSCSCFRNLWYVLHA